MPRTGAISFLVLLLAGCAPFAPGEPEDFFAPTGAAHLAIEIPSDSRQELLDRPRQYVPVTAEYDGVRATVGLRLKGGGSYRALDSGDKPAFKVDFARERAGTTFFGMDKLSLNNMVSDPSLVSEAMAYRAFHDLGRAAPRTRHVLLTVDGEPWGLYLAVEHVGRRFLREAFDSDGGNQYEGDLIVTVGGQRLVADFIPDGVERFELDTAGEPADRADLWGFVEELDAAGDAAGRAAAMERWVDVQGFLEHAAGEVFVVHWDGYVGTPSNFRIYFDPQTERFAFVPWGCDDAFRSPHLLRPDGFHFSGYHPGRLFAITLEEPGLRARWAEALVEAADALEQATLQDELEELVEALEPHVGLGGWSEPDADRWTDSVGLVGSTLAGQPDRIRNEIVPELR